MEFEIEIFYLENRKWNINKFKKIHINKENIKWSI